MKKNKVIEEAEKRILYYDNVIAHPIEESLLLKNLLQELTTMTKRLDAAEKVIRESIINLEKSELPFYAGVKDLKEYSEVKG